LFFRLPGVRSVSVYPGIFSSRHFPGDLVPPPFPAHIDRIPSLTPVSWDHKMGYRALLSRDQGLLAPLPPPSRGEEPGEWRRRCSFFPSFLSGIRQVSRRAPAFLIFPPPTPQETCPFQMRVLRSHTSFSPWVDSRRRFPSTPPFFFWSFSSTSAVTSHDPPSPLRALSGRALLPALFHPSNIRAPVALAPPSPPTSQVGVFPSCAGWLNKYKIQEWVLLLCRHRFGRLSPFSGRVRSFYHWGKNQKLAGAPLSFPRAS